MSTPIEIIREHLSAFQGIDELTEIDNEFTTALASVLRDAERFAALERAHDTGTWSGWAEWNPDIDEFQRTVEPLSELADRLREETK